MAILCHSVSLAQAKLELKGTVSSNGAPLHGASVTIFNLREQIKAYGITNQKGEFSIDANLPDDKYVVSASFIGFQTAEKSILIKGESALIEVHFRLTEDN